MRVWAAAAAIAVWCVSGVAAAAGYAEVWNPPESNAHARQHAGQAAGAAKKSGVHEKKQSGHAAAAGKNAQRTQLAGHARAAGAAHGGKATVHKVKPKAPLVVQGVKPNARLAHAGAAAGARSGAAREKLASNKPAGSPARVAHQAPRIAAQGSRMHSGSSSLDGAASKPAVTVAKTAPARPAVITASATPRAAETAGTTSGAVDPSNPATARSGSLPPILH